jgi:hypothetical protein
MPGSYPYPDDCEECDGKHPCPEHEWMAEGDNQGDRAHKGA